MTNGVVSLVDNNSKTLIKCVVGREGYNAIEVAEWLKVSGVRDVKAIYDKCLELDFGCGDCLVVMDERSCYFKNADEYEGTIHTNFSHLHRLYCEKFSDPCFNPRWENGTAPRVEVVQ